MPPPITTLLAGGIYPLRRRERETTVTEDMAMANPAYTGWKVIPKKG